MQKTKKTGAAKAPRPEVMGRFYTLLRSSDNLLQTALRSGGLVSRNVRVGGRRTSVRLHAATWEALGDAAAREQMSVDEFCTGVNELRPPNGSFANVLRVFLLTYFRSKAGKADPCPATKTIQ